MKEIQTVDRVPIYYERLTVTNTAVSSLNEVYREDSNAAFITVETNNIRYRIDGGDPDANDGHLVYASQNLWFECPASIRKFKAIGSGGNATLIVTYYR